MDANLITVNLDYQQRFFYSYQNISPNVKIGTLIKDFISKLNLDINEIFFWRVVIIF